MFILIIIFFIIIEWIILIVGTITIISFQYPACKDRQKFLIIVFYRFYYFLYFNNDVNFSAKLLKLGVWIFSWLKFKVISFNFIVFVWNQDLLFIINSTFSSNGLIVAIMSLMIIIKEEKSAHSFEIVLISLSVLIMHYISYRCITVRNT